MRDMTDEAESRIAFLKDAFARISAAPFDDRDALTTEFAQEFQRRDPETAAKLKRWGGDGWFLWRACEIALESALVRTDLTADEKRKTLSDGWHCVAALKAAVSPESHGHLPSRIAIDFAFSALLLGLRAGLSPEEIEKIRASQASDMGRSGGVKSAETRKRETSPWGNHASEIAARVRAEQPKAGQGKVADLIMERWKLKEDYPSHRTLVRFISELEKDGTIPPRSGSRQT
jgi:hypothetical protein